MSDIGTLALFNWAFHGLFLVALAGFFHFRGRALLLYFQQEEYDAGRFLRWFATNKAFDRWASLLVLAAYWASVLLPSSSPFADWRSLLLLSSAGLVLGFLKSRAILSQAKKPLVMTSRAKSIHLVTMVLVIGIFALVWRHIPPSTDLAFLIFLIWLQMPPLLMVIANLLLQPYEKKVREKYLAEAKIKLDNLSPTIIGITGSYGKTSTKHILAHILSANAPTLATPGSVNTEMGITRIIREQLEASHKYFVVEMGAYGRGSIARLCKLAPPSMGIITAIGKAHFERFGSLQEVVAAKFELAEYVATRGGLTFLNADQMPVSELIEHTNRLQSCLVFCGKAEGEYQTSVVLESAHQDENGLHLEIRFGAKDAKKPEKFDVPIFGLQQTGNILLAIGVAVELGVSIEIVRASIKSLDQTSHRLEVSKSRNGPTIIDDAYNSNPEGFEKALETLDMLATSSGRRILLTPGMVELGSEHEAEHARLGQIAAHFADIVLVVTPSRIPSFTDAFSKAKTDEQIMLEFDKQADAEAWLKANILPEDVVLFENNLPDLFEAPPRF